MRVKRVIEELKLDAQCGEKSEALIKKPEVLAELAKIKFHYVFIAKETGKFQK